MTLDLLFNFDDGRKRLGWEYKPYRQIYKKFVQLVSNPRVEAHFKVIMCLTHFVLPHATEQGGLISTTKQAKGRSILQP